MSNKVYTNDHDKQKTDSNLFTIPKDLVFAYYVELSYFYSSFFSLSCLINAPIGFKIPTFDTEFCKIVKKHNILFKNSIFPTVKSLATDKMEKAFETITIKLSAITLDHRIHDKMKLIFSDLNEEIACFQKNLKIMKDNLEMILGEDSRIEILEEFIKDPTKSYDQIVKKLNLPNSFEEKCQLEIKFSDMNVTDEPQKDEKTAKSDDKCIETTKEFLKSIKYYIPDAQFKNLKLKTLTKEDIVLKLTHFFYKISLQYVSKNTCNFTKFYLKMMESRTKIKSFVINKEEYIWLLNEAGLRQKVSGLLEQFHGIYNLHTQNPKCIENLVKFNSIK